MKFVEFNDIEEELIDEGYVQIAGRSGGKIVRKYRCTSGSRRGRIVSKPATCTAPKNVKSTINMKKARRKSGSLMTTRAQRTKTALKTTKRLKKLNVHTRSRLKPRRRKTARRR